MNKNDPESPAHHLRGSMSISVIAGIALSYIAFTLPLTADETYYWAWSHNLDWGYFDHPPLIAFAIWLCQGNPRVTAYITCILSIALLTMSAKKYQAPLWFLVPICFLSSPFGLAAGVIATPDSVLLVGETLLLYGFVTQRLLFSSIAICIAVLSKPTGWLLVPAFVVVFHAHRHFWTSVTAIILVYAPHFGWSLSNNMLPWSFQASRQFSVAWTQIIHWLEFFLGQILLVGPLFVYGFIRMHRRGGASTTWMKAITLPSLLALLCLLIGHRVEANWSLLIWPVVLFWSVSQPPRKLTKVYRWQAYYGCLAWLIALLLTGFHHKIPLKYGPDRAPTAFAKCAQSIVGDHQLLVSRYQEAARLQYASIPPVLASTKEHRKSQYDLWSQTRSKQPSCGDWIAYESGLCPGAEKRTDACGIPMYQCACDPKQ